jgi:hypothetical protein
LHPIADVSNILTCHWTFVDTFGHLKVCGGGDTSQKKSTRPGGWSGNKMVEVCGHLQTLLDTCGHMRTHEYHCGHLNIFVKTLSN